MRARLQIAPTLAVTPFIDICRTDFAARYALGVWWCLFGEREEDGPLEESYLFDNLKQDAEHGYFDGAHDHWFVQIGFYLGMIHGGILAPDGNARPDATTLVTLHDQEARRCYHVGRDWFFNDAEPNERLISQEQCIERVRELVVENPSNQDNDPVWHYCLGDLLGAVSRQIFPATPQERQRWEADRRAWEARGERQTQPLAVSSPLLQQA